MNLIKEKYKVILNNYISSIEEDALYEANELTKNFIYKSITPEELVAMHFEVVQELTKNLSAENALQIIDSCMACLVQILVTYGVYFGNTYKKDTLDGWHEAVLNLRSSLSLFQNKHKIILDTIPTGVVTINMDGNVTFVNQKFEEILQLKAKDVLGKPYIHLFNTTFNPNGDNNCRSVVLETIDTKKLFLNFEKEYSNGEIYRTSTSLIRDEEGKISEVIASMENITHSKQIEQAALRNEKLVAIGTLSAGIAHEIRNPLTTIRGFIQLLQPELAQSNKAEYLEIILSEIDRANNVLKDFLNFSKPSLPKRSLTDVKKLLEELHLLTEGEALLRDIHLEFTYSVDNIPSIHIDKDQIKQVILNMIKNALDAVATPGGAIKVSTVWEPLFNNVSIIIKDNGIGMNQQTISKIFDPFFTTKEHGNGLGMAVSYQIVKNHGGDIQVNSFPGSGTTFTLVFPLEKSNEVSIS